MCSLSKLDPAINRTTGGQPLVQSGQHAAETNRPEKVEAEEKEEVQPEVLISALYPPQRRPPGVSYKNLRLMFFILRLNRHSSDGYGFLTCFQRVAQRADAQTAPMAVAWASGTGCRADAPVRSQVPGASCGPRSIAPTVTNFLQKSGRGGRFLASNDHASSTITA